MKNLLKNLTVALIVIVAISSCDIPQGTGGGGYGSGNGGGGNGGGGNGGNSGNGGNGGNPPPLVEYSFLNSAVFQPKCARCHNIGFGGFFTTSYETVIQKTVNGNPEASPVYTQVASGEMPPGNERLSDEEIKWVYDWIRGGLQR